MTKPDFMIKPGRAVWLHGRAWKAGNEAELEEAGFSEDAKRQQADRGVIRWAPPSAPPATSEAPPKKEPAKKEPTKKTSD